MTLKTGTRLGPYEITAAIGAGGMGEVYRARDMHLGREVAIKVLPEEFAQDENRLRRFEREARTLASLNHPNVAGIHGIDQTDGTCFIAMELVPGEDLASRLERGAMPVPEALEVCRQIALGLEAAHEAGVIHRDVKPANVRITPEGMVKVLDFGLARPTVRELSGAPVGSLATTEDLALTPDGHYLGTPLYMAPEQARNKPVDKRMDVWAFGCVLYECLSGRRMCSGEALGVVMVAILEKEPDWTRLPPGTPAAVRTLLERCLDKDPRTRLRDIGEARIILEPGPGGRPETPAPRRRRVVPGAVTAVLGLALAISALAFVLWAERSPASAPRAVHQVRLTEIAGVEETPAISPDGKVVAFISRVGGNRQVFLRLLAKGSPEQVTHQQVDHSFPRWADEDTLIYFVHRDGEGAAGSLWEKAYLGSSSPRLLTESAQGEADVSHSGRTIATFRSEDEGPSLVLMERNGEKAETVTRLPAVMAEGSGLAGAAILKYRSPRWSPDDRYLAFQAMTNLNTSEIRVLDLVGGQTKTVARTGQVRGIAWLPDGSGLVYASSRGSTLAYPPMFSLRTVKSDGSGDAPLLLGDSGFASHVEPDVTAAGKLVASRVRHESDIFRYPIDGSPLENVRNAKRITRQTGQVQVPSASPDGKAVVYLSDSGGHANAWVARVDGSRPPRQITDEQDPLAMIGIPLWSPRGDTIVYWKGLVGAESELWLVQPDGTGQRMLVRAGGGASWSHDGEWLYYTAATGINSSIPSTHKIRVDGGEPVLVRSGALGLEVTSDEGTGYFMPTAYRQGEVWRVTPVDAGTPEFLISNLQSRIPLWPHQYALSPDDYWLATPLRDDGTTNLWLISTDDASLRKITDFAERPTTIGRQVSWSSDSKYIFAALMETDADIVLLDGALDHQVR
jgi:Tol biopolymer transport system component